MNNTILDGTEVKNAINDLYTAIGDGLYYTFAKRNGTNDTESTITDAEVITTTLAPLVTEAVTLEQITQESNFSVFRYINSFLEENNNTILLILLVLFIAFLLIAIIYVCCRVIKRRRKAGINRGLSRFKIEETEDSFVIRINNN